MQAQYFQISLLRGRISLILPSSISQHDPICVAQSEVPIVRVLRNSVGASEGECIDTPKGYFDEMGIKPLVAHAEIVFWHMANRMMGFFFSKLFYSHKD